jgi:formyltetrahydrofolate deformylase
MTLPERNGSDTAILLMYCPDQPGIVAKITEFLFENNGNIISLDQHVDHQEKVFFMRIEWEIQNFAIPRDKIAEYFGTLVAVRFNLTWNIYFTNELPRMAIFVSKMSHCLFDMLARFQSGEWNVRIPLVISNHPDLKHLVNQFGIEFLVFPVSESNKQRKCGHCGNQRVNRPKFHRNQRVNNPGDSRRQYAILKWFRRLESG